MDTLNKTLKEDKTDDAITCNILRNEDGTVYQVIISSSVPMDESHLMGTLATVIEEYAEKEELPSEHDFGSN